MSQSLTALYLQNPELAQAIRRRSMGEQMLMAGGDASPVLHPLQGAARLAQALIGGYEQGQADKDIKAEGERQRKQNEEFMQAAMMPYAPQQAAPAPQPQQGPMTAPMQPVGQQAMAPPDLDPLIQKAAQETGIPANLLTGLFAQESSFRPDARNPRSTATGIAQVLDSTAANPGYGLPPLSPEARLDPAQAIPWAARYLAARGQSLGVSDWTNPQQAERGLRAYGENTPEYAQAVMRRAGMGGETIPAQMPPQGQGAPAPTRAAAAADASGEIQHWQGLALRAQAAGNPGMAGIFMQQAQMARQMAALRAPQPTENERLLMAAGLQPGTPEYQKAAMDLVAAKARGQSVNVGGGMTIPSAPQPGFAYVRRTRPDGSEAITMEPIEGSDVARKREKEDKAEGKREEAKVRAGGIVIEDIGRIEQNLKDAWLPAAGFGATTLANIPGTAASDVSSLLEGIGANIAFDKLQQMREQSPTGAALGAVSDKENSMLQSVYGSLKQSQTEKQFRENLTRLRKIYLDIIHGEGKWTETAPGDPPAPPPGFVPVQPR